MSILLRGVGHGPGCSNGAGPFCQRVDVVQDSLTGHGYGAAVDAKVAAAHHEDRDPVDWARRLVLREATKITERAAAKSTARKF